MTKTYLSNLDSTNYGSSSFKNDGIKKMVQNRNNLLISFGKIAYQTIKNNLLLEDVDEDLKMKFGDSPNVRIIGNPHQPSLIFDNKYIISMFVKNFDVYLSSHFKDGEILCSINLNLCDAPNGVDEIIQTVSDNIGGVDYRGLYTVGVDDELHFSKFDAQGHPYFTKTNPQFYFNEDDANDVVDLLFNIGYKSAMIKD